MHRLLAQPRRVLLGAAVTACAVTVLPGAAQAADVRIGGVAAPQDMLAFADRAGETNRPRLSFPSSTVAFVTDDRPITVGPGCDLLSPTQARCERPGGITRAAVVLGGGNDTFSILGGGVPTVVQGDAGDDTYVGGQSPAAQRVTFRGGPGLDTATYALATAGVAVIKDGTAADDGRKSYDRDSIETDVESLIGSSFDDALVGDDDPASFNERFVGGPGDDFMNGRRGFEVFDMGPMPDGADTVFGGPDHSGRVDYGLRAAPVTVRLSGDPDDGQAGEGDDIEEMTVIEGGSAGDTLNGGGRVGGPAIGVTIFAGGGDDDLRGTAFTDHLDGGPGTDVFDAFGGNDFVSAKDGVPEGIQCGANRDTLSGDRNEALVLSCETRR